MSTAIFPAKRTPEHQPAAAHALEPPLAVAKARPEPKPKREPSLADWERKLQPDTQPKVVSDPRDPTELLLVPTPMLVAEEVASVPAGEVIRMSELRDRLAARFRADKTCPMTTGMFASIVAGAVAAALKAGEPARWPIWRLVRDDGVLPTNWPLNTLYRAALLRGEGHTVAWGTGAWRVVPPSREWSRKAESD